MGTCASAPILSQAIEQNSATWNALGITRKEIEKMYRIFDQIDDDGSGELSINEFLAYFSLDRTRFAVRAFQIMDEDGSGEIDFREFVVAVYNYCTFHKMGLILFAFDLYDDDQSGAIDVDEMRTLVMEVYGNTYKNNLHAQKITEKLARQQKNTLEGVQITHELFYEFCAKHPALLFPAFNMQLLLQKKILGTGYWQKLADKRMKRCKGASEGQGGWREIYNVLKGLSVDDIGDKTMEDIEAMAFDGKKKRRKGGRKGRRASTNRVTISAMGDGVYEDYSGVGGKKGKRLGNEAEMRSVVGTLHERRDSFAVGRLANAKLQAKKLKEKHEKRKKDRKVQDELKARVAARRASLGMTGQPYRAAGTGGIAAKNAAKSRAQGRRSSVSGRTSIHM